MKAFAYNALPGRVVFGAGALQHLQREIERIGAKRALVLSTPQQRDSGAKISPAGWVSDASECSIGR